MIVHKLKIEQKYLHRVLTGDKMFEMRVNDRDFQVGDRIEFLPLVTSTLVSVYYVKSPIPEYEITYTTAYGCADGYLALGIKPA